MLSRAEGCLYIWLADYIRFATVCQPSFVQTPHFINAIFFHQFLMLVIWKPIDTIRNTLNKSQIYVVYEIS